MYIYYLAVSGEGGIVKGQLLNIPSVENLGHLKEAALCFSKKTP